MTIQKKNTLKATTLILYHKISAGVTSNLFKIPYFVSWYIDKL